LIYEDNVFYEGTGLYGYSSLRKVELSTGRVVQSYSLPNEVFGEGITSIGDKIIQITWQSQKGYVFSKENFEKLDEFSYNGEGWGITHDDSKLIISNGSSILTFLDPVTFQVVGTLEVKDGEMPVINLNELEYVKGDVYANVWHQDKIAIINLQTGQVKGWIDLTGLYHAKNVDFEAVLNGIAYDAVGDRLFVTGKRWAQIFEIEPQLIT
jgi:glutamine cyclotransferase